jgi:hypothetical protein
LNWRVKQEYNIPQWLLCTHSSKSDVTNNSHFLHRLSLAMISDSSKLVLAEHAARVGLQTKLREVVIESIGTYSQDKKRSRTLDSKEQNGERKKPAKILAEEATKIASFYCDRKVCALPLPLFDNGKDINFSDDEDSLPSAVFAKPPPQHFHKKHNRRLEECMAKLLEDGLDSDDEDFYLKQCCKLMVTDI